MKLHANEFVVGSHAQTVNDKGEVTHITVVTSFGRVFEYYVMGICWNLVSESLAS